MIKNEKQYKITKKKLLGIEEKRTAIAARQPSPASKDQLILVSLTTMKDQLEEELAAYDLLKKNTGSFSARSLLELPSLIIEYKIRSGMTQKEFAKKIGMKEQQLQRYEAENFQSISFKNLMKIVQAIGLDIYIQETASPQKAKEKDFM
jgi:HTH-type transcriptional regulator/antitoxin HigA